MNEKIMIIDDDVNILKVLKSIFERASFNANVFDNSTAALKAAKESPYDVFLIDLKLPDIDGIELFKLIKEVQKDARYAIITAYGDMNTVITAFKAGVSDFILKPFDVPEIVSKIRNLIVEKNKMDYCLTRLGDVIEDTRITDFNNIFHSVNFSDKTTCSDNCNSTELKKLNEGYNLIIKKNIKSLKKMARKVKKEKQLTLDTISYLSHEIRSPLNSVIGYTRTLLKQCELGKTEHTQEFLNDILSSSLYVLDLTNNLLLSSVLETDKIKLELESISISDILKNIKSSLTVKLNAKQLQFKEEIQNGIPNITSDRLKITQILYNLIDNAIKYTNNGEVRIEVKTINEGKTILFAVKDTGLGITRKEKKTIFKKFERGALNREEGAGLGLSIAKKLVELHNGKIWVESKLNHGSTFYFTIPVKNTGIRD